MSPGSAPVYSPCGVYYGNPYGCSKAPLGEVSLEVIKSGVIEEECPNGLGVFAYGPFAEDYYMSPGFPDVVTTEWKAGSVVDVAYHLAANHGGGYAYRLCKVPEEGMRGLTEECFQQGHLEFFGDKQWIQWDEEDGRKTSVEIEAARTTKGTFPEGSQWTRHPIPNCNFPEEIGPDGEVTIKVLTSENYADLLPSLIHPCPYGAQFTPPAPALEGYILQPTYQNGNQNNAIVDQLVVPKDLTPGDYVLSYRLVG